MSPLFLYFWLPLACVTTAEPQSGTHNDTTPGTEEDVGSGTGDTPTECTGPDGEPLPWTYADADGDGFGASDSGACDDEPGRAENAADCDDTDPERAPDASELCDGIDNDCDGVADEDLLTTYYADQDGDGAGDGAAATAACALTEGYVTNAEDCDDEQPSRAPGQAESCDGLDNDCDGSIDEGVLNSFYADADHDGYGADDRLALACVAPDGTTPAGGDCDDNNPEVRPGANETCGAGDENCDGLTDVAATDAVIAYVDLDGDGFGDPDGPWSGCTLPLGYVSDGSDCDDAESEVFPEADERCDGIDNNCDGVIDTDAIDVLDWYADLDSDGFGAGSPERACELPPGLDTAVGGDCDDTDAAVSPGADELCGDGDEDCDGTVDEDDAVNAELWYDDLDGDGGGDASRVSVSCAAGASQVFDASDCDDSNAGIYAGADEVCDGVDNNCDRVIDEDRATDAETWYTDADADGYGDDGVLILACSAPAGTVARAGDCDDGDSQSWPGAPELCDGADQDCDGETDEADAVDAGSWYPDVDGDGYGAPGTPTTACTAPAGTASTDDDCDDTASDTHPAARESCDDTDNNCDGGVDNAAYDQGTWYQDRDGDGYGNSAASLTQCDAPSGYVSNGADCDDRSATIHPGATESCDTVDQDCDGAVADADSLDATLYYADSDRDGYGDPDDVMSSCATSIAFRVTDNTDCHDTVATAYPRSHGTEVPFDGVDQDCDGQDVCRDFNCDGRPDIVFVNNEDRGYIVDSYLYYGTALGYSWRVRDEYEGEGARKALAEDIDGDGYLDLVIAGYQSAGSFEADSYVYWGTASGPDPAGPLRLSWHGVTDVCVADFDDDGTKDIVLVSTVDDDGPAASSALYLGSDSWSTPVELDVTAATVCVTGTVSEGTGTDLVLGSSTDAPENDYALSALDLDESGVVDSAAASDLQVADLVLIDTDTPAGLFVAIANDAPSRFYPDADLTGSPITFEDTSYSTDVLVDDLDGDGGLDVVFTGTSGSASIYYSSGRGFSGAAGTAETLTVSESGSVAAGDVDLDGDVDLVFANYEMYGIEAINSSLCRQGPSGFTDSFCRGLATEGAVGVAIGDLDGDGYPEIVFSNHYDGRNTAIDSIIYWGSTTFTTSTELPTLAATGAPLLVGAW